MDVSNITVNKQNSILIDCGKKIYIDPLDIEDERFDADYIFVTHDHYDHMSIPDIRKIVNDKTIIVLPDSMKYKVIDNVSYGEIKGIVSGKTYELSDFSFETIPAYNKVKPFHPKRSGWVGYILIIDGKRIYIAGDTDATREAENVICDIALVPIGGKFTMNYKEAAGLINKVKPKIVIPTHYGSLVGNKSDGDEFSKFVDDDIKVELKLQN